MIIRILGILLFSCISFISFSQISSTVIDEKTKEPIPYVNIWIENEQIGTSSDEEGNFTLDSISGNKNLVFSAVGYERKTIAVSDLKKFVSMTPYIGELSEITVNSRKKGLFDFDKTVTLNPITKKEIEVFWSNIGQPLKIASYFPFKITYYQTPYLQKIELYTVSRIESAKFNVILYKVDREGKPGNYLYHENIFGEAKKGRGFTTIDLKKLNIKFPEEGLFIALEFLIIESNQQIEYTEIESLSSITDERKLEKIKTTRYEPMFGMATTENKENSWQYTRGSWSKWTGNSLMSLEELAVKLTLIE